MRAKFDFSVLNRQRTEDNSLFIEVYDSANNRVLKSRTIKRKNFRSRNRVKTFNLDFDLRNNDNHSIEFRVWSFGVDDVRLHKVVIQPKP